MWQACNGILKKGDGVDTIGEENQPLLQKTSDSLRSKWEWFHCFKLNSCNVLRLVLTNRLYKHEQARQFVILLPDEIKLHAAVTRKEGPF